MGEDFATSFGNGGFSLVRTNKMASYWSKLLFSQQHGLEVGMGEEFVTSLGNGFSHWFAKIKCSPIGRNFYLFSNGLEVRMGEDFATSLGIAELSLVQLVLVETPTFSAMALRSG
jgi:hypothetical protein